MKKAILICSVILSCLTISFAQTKVKGVLFKSDRWADIKGKGDWATAGDNPTFEKVEILITDKYVKATFGSKVFNYKIISTNQFSEVRMDYNVTLNGKPYLIFLIVMPAGPIFGPTGSIAISIENIWEVSDIHESTEVEVYE